MPALPQHGTPVCVVSEPRPPTNSPFAPPFPFLPSPPASMSDNNWKLHTIGLDAQNAAASAAAAAREAHRGRVAAEAAEANSRATLAMAEAEAQRRRDVEHMRGLLFHYNQDLDHLAPQLEGDPAGVYHWLAEQRAFLTEAVPVGLLPELHDKTYHAQASAKFGALEREARARLAPDHVTALDRVVHLERVVPRLRSFAAWRDVREGARGWRHTYDFSDKSVIRQVVSAVVVGFFFTACAQGAADMISPALGKLAVLGGYILIAVYVARALVQPGVLRAAEARLARVGETFPRGLGDGGVRKRVDAQRAELAHLGVPTSALDGDVASELGRLRAELADLSARALGQRSYVADLA